MRYSTARVIAWAFGVRVLEKDSAHIVVRVPGFFGERVFDAMVESVVDDFAMMDAARRRNVSVTVRGRVIRIDADPAGMGQ